MPSNVEDHIISSFSYGNYINQFIYTNPVDAHANYPGRDKTTLDIDDDYIERLDSYFQIVHPRLHAPLKAEEFVKILKDNK